MKQGFAKLSLVAFVLGAVSTPALAAVDWTPYLLGMTDSCNQRPLFEVFENPRQYKAVKSSIIKRTKKSNADYHADVYIYHLKNATAFGIPITKIEKSDHHEANYVRVYFANDSMKKLKNKFGVLVGDNIKHIGEEGMWLVKETGDGSYYTPQKFPYSYAKKYGFVGGGDDAWEKQAMFYDAYGAGVVYVIDKNSYDVSYADFGGGAYFTFDEKTRSIECAH
ncbi:hypothetical protein LU293_00290 [Moraxella nasovis]|uniref:hypothetical protein n=1 Tax=Moraxella nasovis TaxID=2904121 RepID=UPI001F6246AF|nr:hypothetical protein [Moraxella nasovis]UNU73391.1 hypothetical protein LU293_00290 [Moraxella nasovis]